jgi:predicted transcriptional regulator
MAYLCTADHDNKEVDILRVVEYNGIIMKYVAKNFRPGGPAGSPSVLGTLEREVMDVLWRRERALGKEVFADLSASRKIAYTTVLTVLERLYKKGLVAKERRDGAGLYVFSPKYSRERFEGLVSEEVLKGILELGGGAAVSSFVDIIAQSDSLDRLERLIEEKRRSLKAAEESL